DQVRKLVTRDCLLVMFENIPSRLVPEDANVLRGLERWRKEQQNEKRTTNEKSVIPSEVEESRGESFEVVPRDPSTLLRMTIAHSDSDIRSSFVIRISSLISHRRLEAFKYDLVRCSAFSFLAILLASQVAPR